MTNPIKKGYIMYALIILDLVPKASQVGVLPNLLRDLQSRAGNISENSSISEGVWLLDLNSYLSFLRILLDWADSNTISYKISYSETKPEFT